MILTDRFWSKVKKEICWEWTAGLNAYGYGQFSTSEGPKLAHRLTWQDRNGTIPNGMCILHKCDNTKCCNPDHLFLGTKTDNAADKVRKGRQAKGGMLPTRRGESNNKAVLTAAQVIHIRNEYADGKRNQSDIGKQFGVTQHAIWCIVNRVTWNHI